MELALIYYDVTFDYSIHNAHAECRLSYQVMDSMLRLSGQVAWWFATVLNDARGVSFQILIVTIRETKVCP